MNSTATLRYRMLTLAAFLLLAATGQAQDAETGDDDANTTAATSEQAEADAATAGEDAEEDISIDEGSYLDLEDDDFRPSEEISADSSITFPTDI